MIIKKNNTDLTTKEEEIVIHGEDLFQDEIAKLLTFLKQLGTYNERVVHTFNYSNFREDVILGYSSLYIYDITSGSDYYLEVRLVIYPLQEHYSCSADILSNKSAEKKNLVRAVEVDRLINIILGWMNSDE